MNTSLINVSPLSSTEIVASHDAIAERDELLALARNGTSVKSHDSAGRATEVLRKLTKFKRLVESSRKSAKAPVLELGKMIDDVGKGLTEDITAEEKRINSLVSNFNAAEAERERQARIKAREEEQRILREQESKERGAMEAARRAQEEADRKARELEEKASRARSETRKAELAAKAAEVKAKAEADAAEAARRVDADTDAAIEKVAEVRLVADSAARQKAAGTALRQEIKFEVEDVYALFEALPGMVVLSPNKAAIKAHLKTLPAGASLPGVKHWKEAKTTIR
jgi:hypothetical protein